MRRFMSKVSAKPDMEFVCAPNVHQLIRLIVDQIDSHDVFVDLYLLKIQDFAVSQLRQLICNADYLVLHQKLLKTGSR